MIHHNYKFLGDTCLVEQLPPDQSSIIFIPETADHRYVGIKAHVLKIGSKFRFSDEFNESMKSYAKPLIVMVSKYLGTALDKTNERIRLYDGEDILAIVDTDK